MELKKLFIGLLVAMVGASSYAVTQYDYSKISGANADYNKPDSQYAAFADRGGRVGLQNALYFNQASYITVSFSKSIATSWGAYMISDGKIVEEYKMVSIGDGKYTAVDKNGNPVKFEAGGDQSIGFYVTNPSGNKIYNTAGLPDGNRMNYVGTGINNGTDYVIGFGQDGEFIHSSDFGQMVDSASTVINVQITSTAPSGQPLPGVLAALAISGAGAGLFRLRNKKRS